MRFPVCMLLALAIGSHAVMGDTVRTRGGAVYEGDLQLDALQLKSVDGEIEVPWSAVRSVRAADGGLTVLLSDDKTVTGFPVEPDLRIKVGVIVRRIPFIDVVSIERSPRSPEEQIRQALKAGEFGRADLATPEMGTFETSCPMRLELTLPSQPVDTIWRSTKLQPFVCDGAVSIPVISFEPRPPRRGVAHLRIEFFVKVGPPRDKRSHLEAELLLDGEVAATGGTGRVSSEEDRSTRASIMLDLSPVLYEKWKGGVEDAKLRLVLTAVDD